MSQFARHSTFFTLNRPSGVVPPAWIPSRWHRWSVTCSEPAIAHERVEHTWNTY
jgi:hypothetical protein